MYEKNNPSATDTEVEQFLDHVLEKCGENSLFYVRFSKLAPIAKLIRSVLTLISFGTVYWSAEPEKIWAVIDVLIEHRIPFVYCFLLTRAHPALIVIISYSLMLRRLLLFQME